MEALLARLDRFSQAPRRRQGEALFWGRSPSVRDNLISAAYFSVAARVWKDRGVTEEHLAPFVAGLNEVRSPNAILDMGTGTGASAAAAAKRFPDARVEAFDRSRRTIRLARETYAMPNLGFHVADYASLPFADQAFDMACLLNATPDPGELHRVTTPDAQILVVSSFFQVPGEAWFERWREIGYDVVGSSNVGKGHWQLFSKRDVDRDVPLEAA